MSGGFYFYNFSTHCSKYTHSLPFLSLPLPLSLSFPNSLKLHLKILLNKYCDCYKAVEHLIHNSEFGGLNPAPGTGRDSLALLVRQ
jgi:hypothetical protein